MKNIQPIFSIETLPNGDTDPSIPRLSLPQVTPAQVIARRQHSYGVNTLFHQSALQIPSFPQAPITPPLTNYAPPHVFATQKEYNASSVSFGAGPQVSFPVARFDFSRSLRSGVTYIPRSMTRHKEPNMTDALIACTTLIIVSLLLLTILYYFGL